MNCGGVVSASITWVRPTETGIAIIRPAISGPLFSAIAAADTTTLAAKITLSMIESHNG